jgi:hypothetical protein
LSESELKKRLVNIKTLAMLKMEKNFIAVLEKGYDRQPYNSVNGTMRFWLNRIRQETDELEQGIMTNDAVNVAEEIADISNLLDYMFEHLQDLKEKGVVYGATSRTDVDSVAEGVKGDS